jgi:hypothetical protein
VVVSVGLPSAAGAVFELFFLKMPLKAFLSLSTASGAVVYGS